MKSKRPEKEIFFGLLAIKAKFGFSSLHFFFLPPPAFRLVRTFFSSECLTLVQFINFFQNPKRTHNRKVRNAKNQHALPKSKYISVCLYIHTYKGANIGMWHLVSRSHTRKPYLFAEFCALLPTTPLSLARDTPHLFRTPMGKLLY